MRVTHLAVATLALTLLLMLVGGVVHATGSALACPDWPLCLGRVVPELRDGVAYGQTHRLVAVLTGALTVALAAALIRRWRAERALFGAGVLALVLELVQGVLLGAAVAGTSSLTLVGIAWALLLAVVGVLAALARARDRLPVVGLLAVELILVQGLLGGLTVALRLPPLLATAHLATSMLFLVALVYIAVALYAGPTEPVPSLVSRSTLAVAIGGAYLQSVLGALVRHAGAGMACGDTLFSCAGVWPTDGPGQLHFAHRLVALVVAASVIAFAGRLLAATRASDDPRAPWGRALALVAVGLVVAQVLVGALSVLFHAALPMVTLHLGIAALHLANLVALVLVLGPIGRAALARPPLGGAPAAAS